MLDVAGEKVTYNKYDMMVGLWPYNVDVTPDGKLALTADNGNSGAADGQVDTVSVIDLEAAPPRVIDKVVVGDGPEGLAISPTGKFAVAMLLRGSNAAKSAFFYNRTAASSALRIDGKKVTKTNEVEVGGLPEGAVFSDDGRYLYVGNFIDPGHLDPARRRRPARRHRQALRAAGPSCIDARSDPLSAQLARAPRRGLSSPRRAACRAPSASER